MPYILENNGACDSEPIWKTVRQGSLSQVDRSEGTESALLVLGLVEGRFLPNSAENNCGFLLPRNHSVDRSLPPSARD